MRYEETPTRFGTHLTWADRAILHDGCWLCPTCASNRIEGDTQDGLMKPVRDYQIIVEVRACHYDVNRHAELDADPIGTYELRCDDCGDMLAQTTLIPPTEVPA